MWDNFFQKRSKATLASRLLSLTYKQCVKFIDGIFKYDLNDLLAFYLINVLSGRHTKMTFKHLAKIGRIIKAHTISNG